MVCESMIGNRLELGDKSVPTNEAPRTQFEGKKFWAKYGDVTEETGRLLRKLESMEPMVWKEEGQETNVRLKRAFHDSLGVEQIIFVFCDDLMRTVYELPWWDEWQDVLGPIFAKLGITRNQMVRCLLAKLPNGTTIPVHHDTGLWSTKSHRVHIPLITSDQDGDPAEQVVFKVGYSEDELERVQFVYGHAVELNNRAKHFVQNNWHRSRVHMIFDYVEPELILPRVQLRAGQPVFQTRRSIFLEEPEDFTVQDVILTKEERSERSKQCMNLIRSESKVDPKDFLHLCRRYADGELLEADFIRGICQALTSREKVIEMFEEIQLPLLISDQERKSSLLKAFSNFINGPKLFCVIGVMKCGTTSLYDYIVQHPSVARAKQKEPHFFDWKWKAVQKWNLSEEDLALSQSIGDKRNPAPEVDLALRNKFWQIFEANEIVMNPDVLLAGEATPSYILGGRTLAERVKLVLGKDTKLVVILRDPVERAYSHYQMTKDTNGTEEQLKRRGTVSGRSFRSLVDEDMEVLLKIGANNPNVDPELFEREYMNKTPMGHGSHSYLGRGLYALQLKQWFKIFPREQFYILRLDKLSKNIQQELNKVFSFLGLSSATIPDKAAKNTRSYEPLDPETEAELRSFYEPHNRALVELLGEEFSF